MGKWHKNVHVANAVKDFGARGKIAGKTRDKVEGQDCHTLRPACTYRVLRFTCCVPRYAPRDVRASWRGGGGGGGERADVGGGGGGGDGGAVPGGGAASTAAGAYRRAVYRAGCAAGAVRCRMQPGLCAGGGAVQGPAGSRAHRTPAATPSGQEARAACKSAGRQPLD